MGISRQGSTMVCNKYRRACIIFNECKHQRFGGQGKISGDCGQLCIVNDLLHMKKPVTSNYHFCTTNMKSPSSTISKPHIIFGFFLPPPLALAPRQLHLYHRIVEEVSSHHCTSIYYIVSNV